MGQTCGSTKSKDEHINSKKHRRKSEILFEAFSKLTDLKLKYSYEQSLGQGGFGFVGLYHEKSSPNTKFAIKTLFKDTMNEYSMDSITREVNILRQMDHPNIVNYIETYEDEKFLYIVMEYIPGCDLLKLISKKKGNFSERDIKKILKVLLTTVLYLHDNKIIHRDLKPGNILFSSEDNYESLKLIDFGLSINVKGKDSLRVGSPFYMAPELLKGEFGYESDVWSIGVILYLISTGQQPFNGKNKNEIYSKIKMCFYNRKLLDDVGCSEELKDLIQKILVSDKTKRLTVSQCLEHPFMKENNEEIGKEYNISDGIINSLREFNQKNILQKEVLFLMARISSEKEISDLKKVFSYFDKENSGEVDYKDFPKVFEELGLHMEINEVKEIFDEVDFHKDGKINYSEFLAATLNAIKIEKDSKLKSIFQYFDPNNTGYITAESVINALKERNVGNNETELNELFNSLKMQGEKMDYKEFREIFYFSSSRKASLDIPRKGSNGSASEKNNEE